MTPSELTITVKNDEKQLKTSHLLYEQYTVDPQEEPLKNLIHSTVQEFRKSSESAEPDSIKVRITLEVK